MGSAVVSNNYATFSYKYKDLSLIVLCKHIYLTIGNHSQLIANILLNVFEYIYWLVSYYLIIPSK